MILIASIIFPAVLAILLASKRLRGYCSGWFMGIAALPALATAVFFPDNITMEIPWLLLGSEWGLVGQAKTFLLFTSFLWGIAGVFAAGYTRPDPRKGAFAVFFLASMTGNLGLLVALDVPTFYSFFALMTFSAYGLVVHVRSPESARAGRIYIATAVLGETLLLAAIFLTVFAAKSILLADFPAAIAKAETRHWITLLAFAGFGVKAGALFVHFWLPLAHPVAPPPASAVLSGAMIKAGLVGWLHFLPLGHGSFPQWSTALILLGSAAVFYAVLVGVVQNDLKTNLAYSSISQMGVMTIGVGIALADAGAARPMLAILAFYALNHSICKGALFLGTGLANVNNSNFQHRLAMGGLFLAALGIAGAPWTGGAVAKYALKQTTDFAPEKIYPALEWLLPLASVATTVLLARFFALARGKMKVGHRDSLPGISWMAWIVLLIAVAGAATYSAQVFTEHVKTVVWSAGTVWAAVWPILLGTALLIGLAPVLRKSSKLLAIPAGDIVLLFEASLRLLRSAHQAFRFPGPSKWQINIVSAVEHLIQTEVRRDLAPRAESILRRWEVAGLNLLLLLLAFLWLVWNWKT